LVRAAVSNLSPELEYDGIKDARVILIAGPAPAPTGEPGDQPGNCEIYPYSWTCWNPADVPEDRFFEFLERDIDPGTVLTDLLDLSDDWRPLLREDSWKHVWVYATQGKDAVTSGPEFAAAFSGMGPSYTNFAFHVLLRDSFVDDDYTQLARDTGGVHYPREDGPGEVYQDFVIAIEELLKTNPLSCVYAIPDPPEGQSFDSNAVNVQYDIGMGLETLGHVDSVNGCAEFGHGWYYDDVAAPQELLFCPQTCGMFKAQELASLWIQFGCDTVQAG
jgi:hypothetical protein